MKPITAIDLFCGAGGTSHGLWRACAAAGRELRLTAVNHWPVAVETHTGNHPWATHHCASLEMIKPRDVVPSGEVDLLVASPECTHHSVARGGRPMNDQARSSAFHVLRWLDSLYVRRVLIENVPEFMSWGPLDRRGRPLKSRRGELFRQFLANLEALGYRYRYEVVNTADYGDPTTRRRFFLIAARGRVPEWPAPTHAQDPKQGGLFGAPRRRWRAAREIIDWSIKGESIFRRKRPLAPATLKRIEAGLIRFCGPAAEPFLQALRPFLIQVNHAGGPRMQDVETPLPTLTTKNGHALIEPFILPHRQFSQMDVDSVERPLRTVTASNGGCHGLVEPFLVQYHSGRDSERRIRSLDQPAPTLACEKHLALAQPFMVPFFGERAGQRPRTHSIEDPAPAITSHGAGGLVEPFLLKYYGTGQAQSVRDPLAAVTTKDRFAVAEPVGVDILFRMLQPHELAAAMGFPPDYRFAGTRSDQVRQIGNAVPVNTARALCAALLGFETSEQVDNQEAT